TGGAQPRGISAVRHEVGGAPGDRPKTCPQSRRAHLHEDWCLEPRQGQRVYDAAWPDDRRLVALSTCSPAPRTWTGPADRKIMTIDFAKFPPHDLAPLLKGLPDDRCQCPHWGFLFKGRIVVR